MSYTVDRIKELMKEQNITPAELSRAAGLNHSTVSRYLSGKVEPKKKSVKAIAKALHVTEAYLLNIDVSYPDLILKYGIDPKQQVYIQQYVSLDPKSQKQIEDFIAFVSSRSEESNSDSEDDES